MGERFRQCLAVVERPEVDCLKPFSGAELLADCLFPVRSRHCRLVNISTDPIRCMIVYELLPVWDKLQVPPEVRVARA